jgi:hypothetical protein
MADATTGVHARLTEIVHYVTGLDMESKFDGQWTLDAKDRARVRRIGTKLIALMDEYDKLDPLPPEPEGVESGERGR